MNPLVPRFLSLLSWRGQSRSAVANHPTYCSRTQSSTAIGVFSKTANVDPSTTLRFGPTACRGRRDDTGKVVVEREIWGTRMAHRRSLGFPGFPVEGCGFEQLHVVLFEENHISGTGESCEVGNPGTLGMTKRRGLFPLESGRGGGALQIPRLPRISCRELPLRSTACGSL